MAVFSFPGFEMGEGRIFFNISVNNGGRFLYIVLNYRLLTRLQNSTKKNNGNS